ncbi:MAG: hypothetical protein IPN27_07340 [Cellvibrionales bacterium]|nr:hypothetical protein [Cellvibrionales bacterium]
MLAVVGIYNFLMFFIVREKSHLYYVFYLASFISAMACIEGVIMENHGEWVTRHALLLLYALNHLMLFFLCFYAAIFLISQVLSAHFQVDENSGFYCAAYYSYSLCVGCTRLRYFSHRAGQCGLHAGVGCRHLFIVQG